MTVSEDHQLPLSGLYSQPCLPTDLFIVVKCDPQQNNFQVKQLKDNIKAAIFLDPVARPKKLFEAKLDEIRDSLGLKIGF